MVLATDRLKKQQIGQVVRMFAPYTTLRTALAFRVPNP